MGERDWLFAEVMTDGSVRAPSYRGTIPGRRERCRKERKRNAGGYEVETATEPPPDTIGACLWVLASKGAIAVKGIDMTRIDLVTVVAVWSAVACANASDVLIGRRIDPPLPSHPQISTAVLGGRIRVTGDSAIPVVELRDVDSDVFRLAGDLSRALASVNGGDVVVWGAFDEPGFVVQDFRVMEMHGRRALDGLLEATKNGFALRLRDGSRRMVPRLDSSCVKYVGARIWVIGWDEDADVVCGPIAAE